MVVVSMLPHAEFGRNDHREDATHCNWWISNWQFYIFLIRVWLYSDDLLWGTFFAKHISWIWRRSIIEIGRIWTALKFQIFRFFKNTFLLGVIRLRLWAQIKHIFAYLILVINMTHIPTEGIWTIGEFRIKNLMTHKNDSFKLKKIVRIFKYNFSHYLYNKVNYFL